jgi:acyl carrier protein
MTQDGACTQLIAWLKERKPELPAIDLDQDLMQSGALDSLQFMNFLLFVEEQRGNPIPPSAVIPENFRSLRVIASKFFD